jgi:hypothetical protein
LPRGIELPAISRRRQRAGLRGHAVDRDMDMIVLRIAVRGVDRLMRLEVQDAHQQCHRLVDLFGCRALVFIPADDVMLDRVGATNALRTTIAALTASKSDVLATTSASGHV